MHVIAIPGVLHAMVCGGYGVSQYWTDEHTSELVSLNCGANSGGDDEDELVGE
jgi:hypothetical protein